MLYREYGKTKKEVSILGFGGMRFKKEDYMDGNYEKCAQILFKARELGINYFDTAPLYCNDKSEEIFGYAFRQMKKDFYVATKNGINNTGDRTEDEFRIRLEQSLKRLNVDKINFMYMWCILDMEMYRDVMKKGSLYDGARKAQAEGLIDHICISTHCTGDEIESILSEGAFEGVLMGYNATNFKYRQQGLLAAKRLGLGVVTMNPLGGGMIPQNPAYYSFLKTDPNLSVAQSAIRFNASHPEITVTLSGMSSINEVEQNIAALENLKEITPEYKEMVSSMLSESLNSMCTSCGYCNHCPKGIPIPKYMESYNQINFSGKFESILKRLKVYWGVESDGAGECIGCGQCESLCTQHLPITQRLKEISSFSPENR